MKIILFGLFILLCLSCRSQEVSKLKRFKFKAVSEMEVYFDKYKLFSFIKEWHDTSFVAVLDITNKKLDLYTSPINDFDIVDDAVAYYEGSEEVIKWTFIDKSGTRGILKLLLAADDNPNMAHVLYVIYGNVIYVYKVVLE